MIHAVPTGRRGLLGDTFPRVSPGAILICSLREQRWGMGFIARRRLSHSYRLGRLLMPRRGFERSSPGHAGFRAEYRVQFHIPRRQSTAHQQFDATLPGCCVIDSGVPCKISLTGSRLPASVCCGPMVDRAFSRGTGSRYPPCRSPIRPCRRESCEYCRRYAGGLFHPRRGWRRPVFFPVATQTLCRWQDRSTRPPHRQSQ